jgi:AraC family transcriptional regulator, regulatory protein of adaptative response / DNA-3-methyladenine glycosylase II
MEGDAMDFEQRYRAMETRDESLGGDFFAAVTTTRIYCRPGCPARTPKRENVRFYRTATAARSDGFRACLRCHPDDYALIASCIGPPVIRSRT